MIKIYNPFAGKLEASDWKNGDRDIPARKIPSGRFHPGCFPPEHSSSTKPGFAKYAVDANLSILTRAKRATNRNNVATNRNKTFGFFGEEHFLGEYTGVERSMGGIFRGGVYLEPCDRLSQIRVKITIMLDVCNNTNAKPVLCLIKLRVLLYDGDFKQTYQIIIISKQSKI